MDSPRSLKEVLSSIHNGDFTLTDLLNHYCSRIKKYQHLNAFIEVYEQEALQNARIIDKKIKNGTAGKLAGMVVGLKDNICYKKHKSTASSGVLKGFESIYSATVVDKLIREDAIIIGRTNCDEFAMGSSNENSVYGPALNYVDNSCVTGGSSGGSAVAVQAGLCLASFGSDTGGSVRQPASFCGVVGLKPTYGRVSRYGLIAYGSSFDQIGPFANNIDDVSLVLEVIAGKDEMDSTSSSAPVPVYSNLPDCKKNTKIAFLNECMEHHGLDCEIRDTIKDMIGSLKEKGHTIEAVNFPYLDYMIPAYQVLTTAEASSNLARYDGIHYGFREKDASTINEVYVKSRTNGFGKEVQRRIMLGTFVLSEGYFDAYYTKAQQVRRLIKNATDKILEKYDFILLPTTPGTAFKIGSKSKDPIQLYLEDIFTVQAPLAGNPAISLPMGKHSNGMPFGIQIIGKRFDEHNLLAFSKYLMNL